ncbi:MAG: WYL domain-containing protein [Clostridia bacterium]|nr:WYL domain-containing protein [Clostridia bacterium]
MIFSELYSAYYTVVANLIEIALSRPVTREDIAREASEHAFDESAFYIEQALSEERWQVLTKDGETPLEGAPSAPPTLLEKRWLKAVLLDPRVKLFGADIEAFPMLLGIEPLFTKDDFEVFDSYGDGDPYDDPDYIDRFRLILSALREKRPLDLLVNNRSGRQSRITLMPEALEYSEKDDKFRLIGSGSRFGGVVNFARIASAKLHEGDFRAAKGAKRRIKEVCFELYDRRNALERVLLHFAHLEKQTEKTGDRTYLVTLKYDESDETELVIRLLSFGPMIKVVEPESFVSLIKQRLLKQMDCEL